MAVNSSPSTENTRAMIREIGVARSLLRSKVALIAAAKISAAAATPITPSIVKPVPKSEPWPKRAQNSTPNVCQTRIMTAERSSAGRPTSR